MFLCGACVGLKYSITLKFLAEKKTNVILFCTEFQFQTEVHSGLKYLFSSPTCLLACF